MPPEPSLFASSIEEPRRRRGVGVWFAAATALVIGIGIGFASGYRAGKGSTAVLTPVPENPAATTGATAGRPFSESSVQEPVNLNPPPIVPAPARQQPTEGKPAPTVVGRVPPRRQAIAPSTTLRAPRAESRGAADPSVPALAGPASLEVVSRPAGAQIILDGRSIGKTPMTIPDVAHGDHNIRLELDGFKGWTTTVGVKGGPTRVAASLEQ